MSETIKTLHKLVTQSSVDKPLINHIRDIHPLIRDILAKYQKFLGYQFRLMDVDPNTWFLTFKCEGKKNQPPPDPLHQIVMVKELIQRNSNLWTAVTYSAKLCESYILENAPTFFLAKAILQHVRLPGGCLIRLSSRTPNSMHRHWERLRNSKKTV